MQYLSYFFLLSLHNMECFNSVLAVLLTVHVWLCDSVWKFYFKTNSNSGNNSSINNNNAAHTTSTAN